MRGAEFCKFLKPVRLKVLSLKVTKLGWYRDQRALSYSWREYRQKTWGQTVETEILRTLRLEGGTWQRDYSLISELISKRQHS